MRTSFKKRMLCRKLGEEHGQTSVEYLMLLAVTFIAAYFMLAYPFARFTHRFIEGIKAGLQNAVQHAEWSSEQITPTHRDHPSNPERLKGLHL